MEKIKRLYNKYYETISYLIFGILTTVVNWGTYSLLVSFSPLGINGSNIIAWIASVLFAFITNKIYVFRSTSFKISLLIPEFFKFVSSRLITGALEIGLVPLLVHLGFNYRIFGIKGFAAKLVVSVIVVILNYFLSKYLVFNKDKSQPKDNQ